MRHFPICSLADIISVLIKVQRREQSGYAVKLNFGLYRALRRGMGRLFIVAFRGRFGEPPSGLS